MDSTLNFTDWVVLLLYVLIVISTGILAGRKEKDTTDYFLAGRKMPWWAVMISIYATALSTLTFIGVPGAAYSGDFHYLQLGIGDLFGRILISYLLLTAYYNGRVTTVYELLGSRFGPRSRDGGTIFFIITRLLASGVRLAGCAIALSVVFNMPLNSAILLITVAALAYTLVGGIKAVIWTDVIQFTLFILAALTAVSFIVYSLPNGWSDIMTIGAEYSKFKIFHVSFTEGSEDYWLNLANPKSLIAGFILGCFATLAALGTDQDLVQRMLTCEKVKQSRKALIMTALLNFPVTLLFLMVGASLYVFYQIYPDPEVAGYVFNKRTDYIFPHFIKTVMAPGLRGLLIAGLLAAAMSSIDSALNALASTLYIDIYKNHIKPDSTEKQAIKVSRWFVVLFAVILAGIAIYFSKTESVLWLGFKIIGYTYGSMLGIFMLAVLTKERGNDIINLITMISSVCIVIFLTSETVGPLTDFRTMLLHPLGINSFAWPWAIMIGTVWTFSVSIMFRTKQ